MPGNVKLLGSRNVISNCFRAREDEASSSLAPGKCYEKSQSLVACASILKNLLTFEVRAGTCTPSPRLNRVRTQRCVHCRILTIPTAALELLRDSSPAAWVLSTPSWEQDDGLCSLSQYKDTKNEILLLLNLSFSTRHLRYAFLNLCKFISVHDLVEARWSSGLRVGLSIVRKETLLHVVSFCPGVMLV